MQALLLDLFWLLDLGPHGFALVLGVISKIESAALMKFAGMKLALALRTPGLQSATAR
jgi:hypothetical protein